MRAGEAATRSPLYKVVPSRSAGTETNVVGLESNVFGDDEREAGMVVGSNHLVKSRSDKAGLNDQLVRASVLTIE